MDSNTPRLVEDHPSLCEIPWTPLHNTSSAEDEENSSSNEIEGYSQYFQGLELGLSRSTHPPLTTASFIGNGLHKAIDIPDFSSFTSHLKVLNLHSNHLKSLEGIQNLHNLEELIVSSNEIISMDFLGSLQRLRILDLSANKILEINGLLGLTSLQRLSLAYNIISNLEGLQQLWGEAYALTYIDLRGNALRNLNSLMFLGGIHNMKEVLFKNDSNLNDDTANPICYSSDYRLIVIQCTPGIYMLDGVVVTSAERSIVLSSPLSLTVSQENLEMQLNKSKAMKSNIAKGKILEASSQLDNGKLILESPLENQATSNSSKHLNISDAYGAFTVSHKISTKSLPPVSCESVAFLDEGSPKLQETAQKDSKMECCDACINTDTPNVSTSPSLLQFALACVEEFNQCSKSLELLESFNVNDASITKILKHLPEGYHNVCRTDLESKISETLKRFYRISIKSSLLQSELKHKEDLLIASQTEISDLKERLHLLQRSNQQENYILSVKQKESANTIENLSAELKRKEMMLSETMLRLNSAESEKKEMSNASDKLNLEINASKKELTHLHDTNDHHTKHIKKLEDEVKDCKEKAKMMGKESSNLSLRVKELETELMIQKSNESTRMLQNESEMHRLKLENEAEVIRLKDEFNRSIESQKHSSYSQLKKLEEEFKLLLASAQSRMQGLQTKVKRSQECLNEQTKLLKIAKRRESAALSTIKDLSESLEEEQKLSNRELYTYMDSTIQRLKAENEDLLKQFNVLKIQQEDISTRYVSKEHFNLANLQIDDLTARTQTYKHRAEELAVKVETLSKELLQCRSSNTVSTDALHDKEVAISLKSRFVEELTAEVQKLKSQLLNKEEALNDSISILKQKENECRSELENAHKKIMEWEEKYNKAVHPLQYKIEEVLKMKDYFEQKWLQAQELVHNKDTALEYARKEVEKLRVVMEKKYENIRTEYEEQLTKQRLEYQKNKESTEIDLRNLTENLKKLQTECVQLKQHKRKAKLLLQERDKEMRILLQENQNAKSQLGDKMRDVNKLLKTIETNWTLKLP